MVMSREERKVYLGSQEGSYKGQATSGIYYIHTQGYPSPNQLFALYV